MKLAVADTQVEHIGAKPSIKGFTIKATSKAFQILSSKLYKNKIAAIVREVSCNALDAHVAAGIPERPIRVNLPTKLEPHFVVRDFGKGMSQEEVETILTTFFESTKEDTNDLIGALGLGFKSPFSYVQAFTVYSTYDGQRTTYNCFVDENGVPNLAVLGSVTSEEETGLEISVPVKPEDFSTFAQEAARIYRWFNVAPDIEPAIELKTTLVEFPRTRWAIDVMNNTYYYASPLAIMGQVAYPISESVLEELDANATTDHQWRRRQNHTFNGLVFYFDIGDLDVQAGREELSYDKRTIAAIIKRARLVKAEIKQTVDALFADCSTMFDAVMRREKRTYFSDPKENKKWERLFDVCAPCWRGMAIPNSVSQVAPQHCSFTIPVRPGSHQIGNQPREEFDYKSATYFIYNATRENSTRFKKWLQETKTDPKKVVVVSISTDRYSFRDQFSFSTRERMTADQRAQIREAVKERIEKKTAELVKLMPGMTLVYAANIKLPAKVARVRKYRNTRSYRDLHEASVNFSDLDENTQHFYAIAHQMNVLLDVQDPKNRIRFDDLGDFVGLVSKADIPNATYFIPRSRAVSLTKNTAAKSLVAEARKKIEAILNDPKRFERLKEAQLYQAIREDKTEAAKSYEDRASSQLEAANAFIKHLGNNTFGDMVRRYHYAASLHNTLCKGYYHTLRIIGYFPDLEAKMGPVTDTMLVDWNALMKHFTLFTALVQNVRRLNSVALKELAGYINEKSRQENI